MTPASHAAVAAVVATRFRKLGTAMVLCFGLHFVLDAVYHFEAFYPLSVLGKWSYERTMLLLFSALAALGAPIAVWVLRKDRELWLFFCYGLCLCVLPFERAPAWKLAWALLFTAGWWLVSPSRESRRWVLCGFVAYLPDLLKEWISVVERAHDAMHYWPGLDLGDWLSLLGRGWWRLHVNQRIFDPYYQTGYALEILTEGAILFGSFYLLKRWRSVNNLPAIDHQSSAVDEGSLVRH